MTQLWVPERTIAIPKPPSYLLADWAFAVGAGAQLGDKSRYRHHGTISGAQWATGLHGAALDFIRATPSYVEVEGDTSHLAFEAQSFSLVMRVNFDSPLSSTMLFCHGADRADGWYIEIGSNGVIDVVTNRSGSHPDTYAEAGTLVVSTWYTLGISRSGTSITIYRNGVDVTTSHGTHLDPVATARTLKIGIYDDKSTEPLNGIIEFCRLFGVALTASEHLAYHNALA